ncbi:prepilin-type N-terminal cleavage/methylation domain-containing protein [Candidatus Kaiserbacteria bacterium]|nr:prepilin-type N-terminal cleavage/methylation domain-containing protein [Candidatus Kaiserbacteria bacterium]
MVFTDVRNTSPRIVLKRTGLRSGFTLIELMVVTGIMIVISGLMFANNNSFGGTVQLENLAYDMALTVRQAQVYGISVQRFSTNTFASAYGVHFSYSVNPTAHDAFYLFADVVAQNNRYDCADPANATPTTCELVAAETLFSGYRVADLCIPKTQVRPCGHSTLDITFHRPNPDAYITADSQDVPYESARIYVTSPRGQTKSVIVETNGQISVQ